MQLAGLLGAVAVAGVEAIPVDAAPRALDGGEDRLHVHGAVGRGLLRVVDGDAAEVVGVPQHVRGHDPDLDEVREIAKAVELRELLRAVGREREPVPSCELEERVRPDGAFEVHVQLDLGVRQGAASLRILSGELEIPPSVELVQPADASAEGAGRGTLFECARAQE